MRMTFTASAAGLADKLAALSFLAHPLPDGEREARFVLTFDAQAVHLDLPDDLTPEQVAEIESVVLAHQP